RGMYAWADKTLILLSLGVCAVAAAGAWGTWAAWGFEHTQKFVLFLLALPLVVMGAAATARQGGLNGLHHVVLAQAPPMLVRPGIMLLLLGGGVLLGGWNPLDKEPDTTASVAMWL